MYYYQTLEQQMHMNFMANTGGLKIMYDTSQPAVYEPWRDPYYNYYDNRPNMSGLGNNNLPLIPAPAWEPPKPLIDITAPVCTRPVFEPLPVEPMGNSLFLESKWEAEQDPNFVRFLPSPTIPNYEDW